MQSISQNILECIGETPLLELKHMTQDLEGRLFAKLEYFSPGLSKKDRIAYQMIEDAEKNGLLKPGQPVIELTSGSMGTGLSIICRQKGYPFIAVMSKGNSVERAKMMKAFGAEVVLVNQHPDSEVGKVTGRDLELVEIQTQILTENLGAYRIDQFVNPSSISTGELKVGPEIINQLDGISLDAYVDFMGTGGNFIGVSTALKKHYPDIKCYGIEPENSRYYSSENEADGRHLIQGGGYNISLPFIDENRSIVDGFITVDDEEVTATTRLLALEEGIFAGYSSGANAAGAIKLLKGEMQGKNVLFVTPDSGTKYLSTQLWDLL
jgi:cysteine synthase A